MNTPTTALAAVTAPAPPRNHAAAASDILIEHGTRADYASLARYHYRAARPAPAVHTLRARDALTGACVGVLVISTPVLNAPWRARAWPQTFAGLSARVNAQAVNRCLRTISRLIVEPRYRSLGIARRLVVVLAAPLTRHTEALAAMGHCCPVFTRAGMVEVPMPRSRRDAAFAAALTLFNLPAHALIEVARARSCLEASPALRGAVRAWAFESKSTRRHLCELPSSPADLEVLTPLAVLAASSITARPRVYVTA